MPRFSVEKTGAKRGSAAVMREFCELFTRLWSRPVDSDMVHGFPIAPTGVSCGFARFPICSARVFPRQPIPLWTKSEKWLSRRALTFEFCGVVAPTRQPQKNRPNKFLPDSRDLRQDARIWLERIRNGLVDKRPFARGKNRIPAKAEKARVERAISRGIQGNREAMPSSVDKEGKLP